MAVWCYAFLNIYDRSSAGNPKYQTVAKDFVIDYTAYVPRELMEYENEGTSATMPNGHNEGLTYRYTYGLERLSVQMYDVGTGAGQIVTPENTIKLYLHNDRLHSTRYATGDNNKIMSYTDYDEWGNAIEKTTVKMNLREIDVTDYFATHDFDPVIGSYYAKARMYSASDKRFLAQDLIKGQVSDPFSLIAYTYVVDNPILRIDPSGLDDVIIYSTGLQSGDKSDWTKQATWMKEKLEKEGRKVVFIDVNSKASFIEAWNNLGENGGDAYSIDDVYVYSHGSERSLILIDNSSTEALSINGQSLSGKTIGNINNLDEKSMDTLYLLSCNAGNIDQYNNGTKDNGGCGNVASVFSKRVKNGVVKAYDGNVGFGASVVSKAGIGGYEPRLSNNQAAFDNVSSKYGLDPNWREPRGLITYYNGEYKPLGYFPNTTISATPSK